MFKQFDVSAWWVPVFAILIVTIAHFTIGANTNALAVLLTIPVFATCLAALAVVPQCAFVFRSRHFVLVLLLFEFTLAIILLQLTKFLPGGAHPLWEWLDSSASVTLDREASFREFIKLIALGAMFIVGVTIGVRSRRATLFFKLLAAVGGLYALWAFVEHIALSSLHSETGSGVYSQAMASFLSTNSAAIVFGTFNIVALTVIIRTSKKMSASTDNRAVIIERLIRHAPVAILSFIFTLTLLFLTASRSGITTSVIAILSLSGWELLSTARHKNSAGKVLGVFMLAIALVALVVFLTSELFVDPLGGVAGGRHLVFSAHWRAFLAAPFSGYGMGAFYQLNDLLLNPQNWAAMHNIGAMHNVYLQWLVEAGAIGSAFMFTTIGLILWHIFKGLHHRKRMHTWLRGILCISLLLLLNGLTDYALQVPSIAMTWALLLGVGFGLATEKPE